MTINEEELFIDINRSPKRRIFFESPFKYQKNVSGL